MQNIVQCMLLCQLEVVVILKLEKFRILYRLHTSFFVAYTRESPPPRRKNTEKKYHVENAKLNLLTIFPTFQCKIHNWGREI